MILNFNCTTVGAPVPCQFPLWYAPCLLASTTASLVVAVRDVYRGLRPNGAVSVCSNTKCKAPSIMVPNVHPLTLAIFVLLRRQRRRRLPLRKKDDGIVVYT